MAGENTLVYFPQGGESMQVASGGVIEVQEGGLIAYNGVIQPVVAGAIVTISAAQASANAVVIDTGLTTISAVNIQVLNTGNNVVTSDADITISGGTVTVADGSTYNTVENYLLHWIAVGA